MYRYTRTATIAQGADTPTIIAFATELNAHMNKALDLDMKFGLEMFNSMRVHWTVDFASLSEFEEKFGKLMADTEYWGKLEQTRSFWIPGSVADTMVRIMG